MKNSAAVKKKSLGLQSNVKKVGYQVTQLKLPEIHPLLHAAERFPDNPALICDETLTYQHMLNRARIMAGSLRNRGLAAGDVVVLDACTPMETITALWMCFLGGFLAFPVNTRFPIAHIKKVIQDVDAALIVSNRMIDPERTISYTRLMQGQEKPENIKRIEFNPDLGASLLMTSGSSGSAKIIQHSLRNHLISALGSSQNISLGPNDRWLLTLPLYHVGGLSLLFRTALAGATLIVPKSDRALLENISEQGITHISLVATQLQRLLTHRQSQKILCSLKAILLGGSALPTALHQRALEMNLPLYISYGSTEMASQITTTSDKHQAHLHSHSGQILPGRDLIISHDGEILVQGETLAEGYYDQSNLIRLQDEDGWFHTGDVGFLDVQGCLTVTGRLDNQFISGGENIQPEHIESILTRLPGIFQAVVLPIPDAEFGFRPVAFLRLEESDQSLQTIQAALKKKLPGYMIPIRYYLFPSVFSSDELKISRQKLSEYLHHQNKHLHSLT